MYGASFTGIGRYTAELIKNLAELDKANKYVIFLRKENFEKFEVPNERFTKVLADFGHYTFGEQIGFYRLLNKLKLDLVHFTHFNAPILYRRPYVVTIHDLTLSFFPGKKMTGFLHRLAYQWVLRNVVKKAKAVISVSEHTKKDMMEVLKTKDEKVTVIYNGISAQFEGIEPTPRQDLYKKLGLEKPFFLYTGVWRSHKNVVGMIKAFHAFNEKMDHQYNLVITGRHNPTYHEIPDTVKELKAEEDIHLVGLVSEADLVALYENAVSYVFPSFYEGFGLPPLEAMLHGTPVIASNQSAIPEVCGEGNALFFDPYKIEDIEEKMKQIATDAALRQQLVDNGKKRVEDFDWKKNAEAHLDIYNKMLHG